MSRRAILDPDGTVVNVVEVATGDITAGLWGPPDGHVAVVAETPRGDQLAIGDTANRETGALVSRKPVPAVPNLPEATILVYGDDPDAPQDQFGTGETVNIRVTLPETVTDRTIAVPVDRIGPGREVLERAALWFRLEVTDGAGTIAHVFEESGCYGVGAQTSLEFNVPETIITVFA